MKLNKNFQKSSEPEVQHFEITEAADRHNDNLHKRQIHYALSQLFRIVCIFLIVFIDNWLIRILLVFAAAFLPWIAVLRANDNSTTRGMNKSSFIMHDSGQIEPTKKVLPLEQLKNIKEHNRDKTSVEIYNTRARAEHESQKTTGDSPPSATWRPENSQIFIIDSEMTITESTDDSVTSTQNTNHSDTAPKSSR